MAPEQTGVGKSGNVRKRYTRKHPGARRTARRRKKRTDHVGKRIRAFVVGYARKERLLEMAHESGLKLHRLLIQMIDYCLDGGE